MRSIVMSLALTAGLFGVPMVTGCDKTEVKEEKVTSTPSGTKTEEKTITQHNDGSVTKTEETHKTNTP